MPRGPPRPPQPPRAQRTNGLPIKHHTLPEPSGAIHAFARSCRLRILHICHRLPRPSIALLGDPRKASAASACPASAPPSAAFSDLHLPCAGLPVITAVRDLSKVTGRPPPATCFPGTPFPSAAFHGLAVLRVSGAFQTPSLRPQSSSPPLHSSAFFVSSSLPGASQKCHRLLRIQHTLHLQQAQCLPCDSLGCTQHPAVFRELIRGQLLT